MGKEIYNIINDMAEVLNASQMQKLQEVLINRLSENNTVDYLQTDNEEFLDMFLTAKHLEGCSDKTIRYYRCNIEKMLETINIPVIKITTEMLRKYLVEYQAINNCGKVTIDNIRRSLSTFFSWLEEEDYIIKSPMKGIHKVKSAIIVKDTISDEKVEILRDNCNNLRDRAMIDFLLSTGIRVGELVRLNIDDIDFSERECVVYGKGDKERKAYFDAKTKIHLINYIESRTDNNSALFVSLNKPHNRLTESGVELRLREMGKKLGVEKVHPHKFRRTMATRAIGIIKGEKTDYVESIVNLIQEMTKMYVDDLLGTLRERGIDLKTGCVVFIGGGALLLREYLEKSAKVGKCIFIEDICVNTKGYELLYRIQKKGR